jgi:hypothetical protein
VEFIVDGKVCDTWLDETRATCVYSHPTGHAVGVPYPPASAYPDNDTYGVLEFGGPHRRATVQMRGRSCVLRGRQVYCHGTNEYGQLGDPTRSDGAQFFAVPGLDDVISLDSDQLRSCAVHASGQVVCWGDNQVEGPYPHDPELCLYSGKPTRGCNRRPTPLAVTDARQVVSVGSPNSWSCRAWVAKAKQVRVSRYGGACLLLNDGGVSCWGKDNPPRGLRDIVQLGENCERAGLRGPRRRSSALLGPALLRRDRGTLRARDLEPGLGRARSGDPSQRGEAAELRGAKRRGGVVLGQPRALPGGPVSPTAGGKGEPGRQIAARAD